MITGTDVLDLLKNKDEAYQATDRKLAEYKPAWTAHDPAGLADFMADWIRTVTKYNAAKTAALATLHSSMIPDAMHPMDAEYQAIVLADQAHPMVVTKGDLADLVLRLTNARGAYAIANPQPHPDVIAPAAAAAAKATSNVVRKIFGPPAASAPSAPETPPDGSPDLGGPPPPPKPPAYFDDPTHVRDAAIGSVIVAAVAVFWSMLRKRSTGKVAS